MQASNIPVTSPVIPAFDFASHPLFASQSTNGSGFEAIPVEKAAVEPQAAAPASVAPRKRADKPATPAENAASLCDYFFQRAQNVVSGRIDCQPGYLRLGTGRAVAIHAPKAGVLRIAQGRVWVTFSNAAQDNRVRAGDYFVGRGDALPLLPGHSVVIEAFDVGNTTTAFLSWEPYAPQRQEADAPARWALA